jgi:uncharacterized protein YprB with RNaseH-like and TPR domain
MSTGSDKYSRLVSLRPAAGAPNREAQASLMSPPGADRIARLLKAEQRETERGRHLVVRRLFPDLTYSPVGPRARHLLFPGGAESTANPRNWIFLDTETTGLAGGTGTYAFLVGIAGWDADGFTVEQYFMPDHSQEASMLLDLTRRLVGRPVFVTYNGKSFDCPLLETRFRMTRLGNMPLPEAHLDLLHPARTIWKTRLRSVALGEIERHILSLDRGPDIPAETIPGRYFAFLRGGPAEPLVEVFDHNAKDLHGMAVLALHIVRMLEETGGADCDSDQLYGMSRLLRIRGEEELALELGERALAKGLSGAAERSARRDLALLSRRRRDYQGASLHWGRLLGDSSSGMEAYEQLAIYHEHHSGDLDMAVRITREALVRLQDDCRSGRIPAHQYQRLHAGFQHRLARLLRKSPRT